MVEEKITKKENKNEIEIDESKHVSSVDSKFIKNMKKNPWMTSTFVFAVISVLLIGFIFFGKGLTGNTTGNVIASDAAGEKLTEFIQAVGANASVINVSDKGDIYELSVLINGQEGPIYMTKDGQYIIQGLVPIDERIAAAAGNTSDTTNTQTPTPQEVPKTSKPVVELFVFSYCPYGLQMEKAFAPVYDLLSKKADIKIRQIGAMHGEFEKIEAERQLCIVNQYNTDKLWAYLKAFDTNTTIGSCNGEATCVTPKINAIYTKLGISASKIDTCMKDKGEDLYNAEVEYSSSKQVSGSPTVFINGVDAQLNRSPDEVKTVICNAFTTVPTTECSKNLSTTAASPGFGESTASSSTGAQC
jgi:hypothetical protein